MNASIPTAEIEAIHDTVRGFKRTEEADALARDRLRSLVDRIERLEGERAELASDINDIYTEAASAGFDKKVLRMLIRTRKQDPDAVQEQETLLDVYRRAIGG